ATITQLIEQTTPSSATTPFEDEPPSYDQIIVKDLPQIHDNYDHLRGPPGLRGVDLKTRIPPDSTPASHYHQSGVGGSGSADAGAAGSSSSASRAGNTAASPDTRYGSIPQQPNSSSYLAAPSAPLQGQIALGPDDDRYHHRSVDRLLGPNGQPNSHLPRHGVSDNSSAYDDDVDDDDDEPSHWSIVGEGRVWLGLFYGIVFLLPWSLFCFVWIIVTLIVASVAMIIPPVGYFFVVATVTSWRALARVDLALSTALVKPQIRHRYPHRIHKVFVTLPTAADATSVWVPGLPSETDELYRVRVGVQKHQLSCNDPYQVEINDI
ncbi:hypothetical protein BG004_002535, partial [Podila humilis]